MTLSFTSLPLLNIAPQKLHGLVPLIPGRTAWSPMTVWRMDLCACGSPLRITDTTHPSGVRTRSVECIRAALLIHEEAIR